MNEQRRDFEDIAKTAGLAELFIEQIRKLAELRDEGVLTDEEFAAKKQELLARI